MYAVIVENDESQWNDETGVRYHFPKRYIKYLEAGTKVIYYKGKLQSKKGVYKRLSDLPHYFALGEIGCIYEDEQSAKGDVYALINEFSTFDSPVLAKEEGNYLENIPSNQANNYWRNGVRPITLDIYELILSKASFLNTQKIASVPSLYNDIENTFESRTEGAISSVFTTRYERDPILRKQAIAIHGCSCKVCGFNFSEVYGDYGAGYIHIHHLKPVSQMEGAQSVDPKEDLIPLCANCHSMIHRRKDKTLSIDELQRIMLIERR